MKMKVSDEEVQGWLKVAEAIQPLGNMVFDAGRGVEKLQSVLQEVLDWRNGDLVRKAEEKITCCGEWTWVPGVGPEQTGLWGRSDQQALSPLHYACIQVCAKCHRALLKGGRMTGPLVDAKAIRNRYVLGSLTTGVELLPTLTWGGES